MEPPKAKYRFEFSVDANSHDEIFDALSALVVNYVHRTGHRDALDIVSSDRTTIRLRCINPDQTPEKYGAELRAWAEERRHG